MGVIVDKKNRTTAWYLFNKRFTCRAPIMATQTVEDIKLYGTPTTGDPVIDREMAQQWPMRMLTIAEMLEIYTKGYDIRLPIYSDSKAIYEIISNHLLEWKHFFTNAENNRVEEETIEELIQLDAFASAVYEPAKHLFTREIATSLFGRYRQSRAQGVMLNRSVFSKAAQRAAIKASVTEAADPAAPVENKSTIPDRQSMSPLFNHHRTIGGSSWR